MVIYEIRSSPIKGLGVFAVPRIYHGDRIISEKPIIMIPRNIYNMDLNTLISTFQRLPEEEKEKYLQLYTPTAQIEHLRNFVKSDVPAPKHLRELVLRVTSIMETNAFGLTIERGIDIVGVFLVTSRINHSCRPNATVSWNSQTGCVAVHATADIPAGGEVLISYHDQWVPDRDERQQSLRVYDFICTCPYCDVALAMTKRGKISQSRREQIYRLKLDLAFFIARNVRVSGEVGPLNACFVDARGVEQPFEAFKKVERLTAEEGLVLHELADWYVLVSYSVVISP